MADEKKEEAKTEKKLEAKAKKSELELSGNAQKIMEMVEKMTVLELADLVKALEEKFGVSAATPMALAATPGANGAGGDAPAVEEKSEFDVVIMNAGAQKVAVIKVVRELDQSLGLIDAKNLVDQGEATVLTGAKKEAAQEAKKKLEEAGAKVELR